MLWRVRMTMVDRPGILAGVATACGEAGINILTMQVFSTAPRVTDEFVVSANDSTTDIQIAETFESAGAAKVAVTRVSDAALSDAPTRYLNAVHQVLEEGRSVEEVLIELLETEPPDVADYVGHDSLELMHRNGGVLTIRRAVPFTPAECARAQALLSLVDDAGADIPLISPSPHRAEPVVREAMLADLGAVAALHERCSVDTLYTRYQVPLRMPMTTRMARRMVMPASGTAIVVQVGTDVVAHGMLENSDGRWTLEILVEDAWQGRGLGTRLIKYAASLARANGADRLTMLSASSNDSLLQAVGSAGFVARVERHGGVVHISVPLSGLRANAAG